MVNVDNVFFYLESFLLIFGISDFSFFTIEHRTLLFIKEADVCNFADDTTLCKCESDLDIVLENLERDANIAIN